VQVRPDLAALNLLEPGVVDNAQNGLEEKEGQDDKANDGMVARIWV